VNSKQQERSSEKHGRRSWLRPPPGRTHNRRRSRLQAAPPHTSPSSRPPPGRAYVSRTLYRRHGRLQAALTPRRALNDHTLPQPFRDVNIEATRSSLPYVDGTFIIYVPPSSPYSTVRAALRHSATHTVKSPPRMSQRDDVNSAPGAPLQGAKGTPKNHPLRTAGARKLPLAATAASEAQLPRHRPRNRAQVGHALYRPSSGAQPRGRVSFRNTSTQTLEPSTQTLSLENNLQLTLEHGHKSIWKTSAYHQEEIICKNKCINCHSLRSTETNVEYHLLTVFLTLFTRIFMRAFFTDEQLSNIYRTFEKTVRASASSSSSGEIFRVA